MAQKQYTERPYKVRAEHYTVGMSPDPIGLCRCTNTPMYPTGDPHVHTARGVYAPITGDWIGEDVWSPHEFHIFPDAEFVDRFAGPPAEG